MSSETTSSTEDSSLNSEDGTVFQCPFCESTYDHEILTRVHITRLNDDAHRNYDGLMPETPVEIDSPEYDDLDRVTRQPEEIDLKSMTVEHLPDDLSPREKRIILIAVYNPYVEKYTELHDRVSGVFDERGLEPVSYNKVRQTILDFFGPFDQNVDSPDSAKEQYEKMTDKQQLVIDAYLEDPSASQSKIAEQAGVSRTYPSQIFSKYDALIDELEAAHDEQDLSDTDADAATADEPADSTAESDDGASTEEQTSDESSSSETDGPVNTSVSKIMSASPYDEPSEQDSTPDRSSAEVESASEASTSDETTSQEPAAAAERESPTPDEEEATQSDADAIPREEVLQLKERISFLRRVSERQTGEQTSSADGRGQLAVAKEVEAELERLLADSDAGSA